MNKVLQIALLLTAVDRMSDVAEKATSNVQKGMQKIKKGYTEIMTGMAQAMSGKMLIDNTVRPMTSAFNQVQDHATNLRIAMMKDGGTINEGFYKKLYGATEVMSEKFGEARTDYLDMFKVLKGHHISEVDLLGVFGQDMAAWAKLMETSPLAGTKFMAGLKMDLNLTTDEMRKMMDLVQRLHFGEGVGNNPTEAIEMLKDSFSIASLGMTNLKYTGFAAARDFSAMLVPFLRRGLPGETLGTGFRKIWANMLDKDKMAEFNEVAASYGKSFEFFDKQGNFLGLENFMRQMDLFKGMSMPDVNSILMPLTGGKTGLSSDVFKILAQEGSEGFNAGIKSIYLQGDMYSRLTERMKQQSVQQARLNQMWENAKVQIGTTLVPMMITLTSKMMGVARAIKSFASAHPTITATIMKLVGFAGTMMMVAGSLKMLKGLWLITTGSFQVVFGLIPKMVSGFAGLGRLFVFLGRVAWMAAPGLWAMTTALLANPITWIVLGIVAVIAGIVLLVKNWDKVRAWWGQLMTSMKAVFSAAWNWIWDKFTRFNIFGILIKNWGGISAWFGNMWGKVKLVFNFFGTWLAGFGTRMWQAGKNIIMSIVGGIKAVINAPVDAMRAMVQKVRNLLPFSPAKEGPLRDIHRIRLIETIAESIKPTALLEKMRSVASNVFQFTPVGMMSSMATPNGSVSGGGINIHFAPVYNARPGGSFASDKEDFMAFMNKNKREIVDVVQDELSRRQSRSY